MAAAIGAVEAVVVLPEEPNKFAQNPPALDVADATAGVEVVATAATGAAATATADVVVVESSPNNSSSKPLFIGAATATLATASGTIRCFNFMVLASTLSQE